MIEIATYIATQSTNMQKNFDNLEINARDLKQLGYVNSDKDFTTDIYNLADIKNENEQIFNSSLSFDRNIKGVKDMRFYYEIGLLTLVTVLVGLSYLCNYNSFYL